METPLHRKATAPNGPRCHSCRSRLVYFFLINFPLRRNLLTPRKSVSLWCWNPASAKGFKRSSAPPSSPLPVCVFHLLEGTPNAHRFPPDQPQVSSSIAEKERLLIVTQPDLASQPSCGLAEAFSLELAADFCLGPLATAYFLDGQETLEPAKFPFPTLVSELDVKVFPPAKEVPPRNPVERRPSSRHCPLISGNLRFSTYM